MVVLDQFDPSTKHLTNRRIGVDKLGQNMAVAVPEFIVYRSIWDISFMRASCQAKVFTYILLRYRSHKFFMTVKLFCTSLLITPPFSVLFCERQSCYSGRSEWVHKDLSLSLSSFLSLPPPPSPLTTSSQAAHTALIKRRSPP